MPPITFLPVFVLLLTSACVPLVVGAGATTGVAVAQERTVGAAVDDAGIHARISNKFIQADTSGLYSGIGIEVTEGTVLLTGQVNKPETSVQAVTLTWEVEGVREVINEIQITDKSGARAFARDAWITAQVKSRLIAEKGVLSVNYNVETVNGAVYLIGIAQNQLELDRALNVASRVKGVQQVVSHVRLKDDPRRPVPSNNATAAPAPVSQY